MLDKTERIDETLNPKWHDHCYRGDIPMTYYENRDALVLRIYDWDYFGGDDVMGQVYIPLQDITSYGTEAWYPVSANPEKSHSRRGRERWKGHLKVWAKLSGLAEPQAPAAPAVQPVGGKSLDSNELRALATILGIAGQLSSEGVCMHELMCHHARCWLMLICRLNVSRYHHQRAQGCCRRWSVGGQVDNLQRHSAGAAFINGASR